MTRPRPRSSCTSCSPQRSLDAGAHARVRRDEPQSGCPGRRRSTAWEPAPAAASPGRACRPRVAHADAAHAERVGSRDRLPRCPRLPVSGVPRPRPSSNNRVRCVGVSACRRLGRISTARGRQALELGRRLHLAGREAHAPREAQRREVRIAPGFARDSPTCSVSGTCSMRVASQASASDRCDSSRCQQGALFHARVLSDFIRAPARNAPARTRRALARVPASGRASGVGDRLPRRDQLDRNRRVPPAAGRRAPGAGSRARCRPR